MPDPNTEHGLRVQLATTLRERDEARRACAEMRCERDDYKEAHRHANETITVVFENRVKKAEEALAAEKARADAAEAKLRESEENSAEINTHWTDTLEALAAARRECEQAESERDAASEVLRDALAWEAETRGRLGLPQIDAPMWAQIARAALGGGCALDENEQVKRLTAAMREADRAFQQIGGSTRHHVRDCLLPILEKHGLRLVAALAAPAAGEEGKHG